MRVSILRSRRAIVVITVGLLMVLDLGRSVYARVGYARPHEVWQPVSSVYADLTWPPGGDLPPTAPLGEHVYMQRCAVCHGPTGQGNGPAAPSMIPRPRNFALGQFKYKSTPAGLPPSDDDLAGVVRNGLHASAMPHWNDLLSDEEISAVVARVKAFSPVFTESRAAPILIPPRIPPTEDSIVRGSTLYEAQCANCHGADGRARVTLKDAAGYPVGARDLAAPWTFRGSTPEQIWLRLTTGLAPAPMPSFANTLTAEQRWDVVNYVLSLGRNPPWEPGGHLDGPGQQPDLTKRGAYIVHASMCGLCHTPINRTGIYRGDDFYLGGGMRVGAYPHGVLVSRNLTSDPETGLGRWSEEQIIDAITNGRSPGRLLNVFDMPWTLLHRLQPEDARAVARYLKTTLAPVRNRVPGPLRYGVIETIAVKIARGLPPAVPEVLTFADGLFGRTGGGISRDMPQTLLVAAQWLVLVLGVAAFIRAAPKDPRRPRTRRRLLLSIAGVAGVLILGLVGWTLYSTPALRLLPPEQLVSIASPLPPVPRLGPSATPQQAELAARGHYLYTVSSCALCHGSSGAGGVKFSWRPMGTLWSRNITPDPNTGIGRWSDAQVARAIRSGIAADGRALHWQGMIWDHLSNLDEEDVRALVAYLRSLPPVRRQVPPARPPAADDCETYTFWLGPSLTPGCR